MYVRWGRVALSSAHFKWMNRTLLAAAAASSGSWDTFSSASVHVCIYTSFCCWDVFSSFNDDTDGGGGGGRTDTNAYACYRSNSEAHTRLLYMFMCLLGPCHIREQDMNSNAMESSILLHAKVDGGCILVNCMWVHNIITICDVLSSIYVTCRSVVDLISVLTWINQ